MVIFSPIHIRLLPQEFLEINTLKKFNSNDILLIRNIEENKKMVIWDYYLNKLDELVIRIYNPARYLNDQNRMFAISKDVFTLQINKPLCEIFILKNS